MITRLKDGMMLYHGSYCEVQIPKLEQCKKYKDFGQVFYLTTDIEQAKKFATLSLRKAVDNMLVDDTHEVAYVSCFKYMDDTRVSKYIFDDADSAWLHFVVGHRKKDTFTKIVEHMQSYDIIGGKIANDATNATILAYMAGTFGEIGTEQADNFCISLLLPERLKDQYCFRTDNVI